MDVDANCGKQSIEMLISKNEKNEGNVKCLHNIYS
jgi:hypothetical protein